MLKLHFLCFIFVQLLSILIFNLYELIKINFVPQKRNALKKREPAPC